MTWALPRTWSTGDQLSGDSVSSGSLNLQLRDKLKSLRGMNDYAIRLYAGTDRTLGSGAFTTINWDRHDWEAGATGLHATASASKLTAPVAGIYELTGVFEWHSNASGYRAAAYRENGTSLYHIAAATLLNTNQTQNQPIGTIVKLTTADYIELQAFQNSGTTGSLHCGTIDRTHCVWRLLGAAS